MSPCSCVEIWNAFVAHQTPQYTVEQNAAGKDISRVFIQIDLCSLWMVQVNKAWILQLATCIDTTYFSQQVSLG